MDCDSGRPCRRASADSPSLHGLADILVAGTDYQREAIARAVPEGRNRLLTIEDVIIHKLIAGRYQDDADIESILATKPALDRTYLDRWIDYWDVGDRWQRLSAAE